MTMCLITHLQHLCQAPEDKWEGEGSVSEMYGDRLSNTALTCFHPELRRSQGGEARAHSESLGAEHHLLDDNARDL
jgi:hypothetical protein